MARKPVSLLDFYSSETAFATEFRRILHNINSSANDPAHKSILVTSSTLSEGKSTVSAMLSITAAWENMKTLLIDTDLRRPSLHKLFLTDRAKGLSEILMDNAPIKAVTRATVQENLDLITAGRPAAEPSVIFDATVIGRVIEEAKFYYDLIVLDSAPIIPVSDPMLLAREVDGIVMVVRAGKTQKEVIKRAAEIVGEDKDRLFGVVLNNVSAVLPYYYDERYYGYHYNTKSVTSQNQVRSKNPTSSSPQSGEPTQSGEEKNLSGSHGSGKMPRSK